MRASLSLLALLVSFAATTAFAHGPQIQLTNDNNKIVTRTLIADGPYSGSLTSPKSVYVMPLLEFNGVWYSRPNDVPSTTIPGAPEFFSGPGFAYGYDLADGGPQAFDAGSVLTLAFTNGLRFWNGAAFGDAGATELKAFRGSNVNITSPPGNFAVTSDSGPFDNLSLPAVEANYGDDAAEVHATLRFGLLGDGSSPTSASADGVYRLSLQLSSTQSGLAASDEFVFVLHKNASHAVVVDAVNSLGVAPSQVQWVPEPSSLSLLIVSAICVCMRRRRLSERFGVK